MKEKRWGSYAEWLGSYDRRWGSYAVTNRSSYWLRSGVKNDNDVVEKVNMKVADGEIDAANNV